mgnify:CR=1 FL=1
MEIGNISLVQFCECLFVGFILPDFVQQGKEIGVVLAVDLFQFDGGVGGFFQGAASEEIGGIIIVTQHIPFRFFHYGGKLLQVTNHQQLYASKGFVSVPIPAEYGVDGIQQICLLWWVQYLPYYLAGYLISRTISRLPGKGWLVALFIGSMLLHGALLIYLPYQLLGRVGVNFFPLVVLKVVSLFALCYRWRPTARLFVSASTLYPYVMGIYLVHFAVLQVVFKLFELFLPALTACPAVSLPLRILLIALISLGVTALLRKVPLLRPLV